MNTHTYNSLTKIIIKWTPRQMTCNKTLEGSFPARQRGETPCFVCTVTRKLQQQYEKFCSFLWLGLDFFIWCFLMIWLYHLGTLLISILHPTGMLHFHDFRVNTKHRPHQLQVYISRHPRNNSPNQYLTSLCQAIQLTNVMLLFPPQQFKQNEENTSVCDCLLRFL